MPTGNHTEADAIILATRLRPSISSSSEIKTEFESKFSISPFEDLKVGISTNNEQLKLSQPKNESSSLNSTQKKIFKSDRGPLVTIIMVVLNAQEFVEKTILSVLNQSYRNVEFIVIDGGSSDQTVEIIRKYGKCIDHWRSEPDNGIYDAWNKGIALSSGEWIGFLGAGDYFNDYAISNYVDAIKKSGVELEYISSRITLLNTHTPIRTVGVVWCWNKFKKYMCVAHVGSLHHRSLYEKLGVYDTSYRICGDYELLLRAGFSLKAAFLEKVTAFMPIGGVSNTDPAVFVESLRAKHETGKRNYFICVVEGLMAFIGWRLRGLLVQK